MSAMLRRRDAIVGAFGRSPGAAPRSLIAGVPVRAVRCSAERLAAPAGAA